MADKNVTNTASIPFTSYMCNPYMNPFMGNPTANYAASVGSLDLANSTGLNFLGNIGLNNSLGIYDPMSMNCGLFPYMGGMGMGGMYGGMGGMYGGMYGYQTPQAYAQSMNDYSRAMATGNMQLSSDLNSMSLNMQAQQKLTSEAVEFRMNAPDDEIARAAGTMHDLIVDGKRDQVQQAFENLKKAVKEKLQDANKEMSGVNASNPMMSLTGAKYSANIDEERLKTEALKAYKEKIGKTPMDDLLEHGGSAFWAGAKKGAFGLGWLFTDSQDPMNIISNIQGTKLTNADFAKRNVGIGASALATTALAVLALPLIGWCVGKGSSKWWELVKGLYSGRALGHGGAL